jgi:hypothetical protein
MKVPLRQRGENRNKLVIICKSTPYISRLEKVNYNVREPVSLKTELHDAIWRGDRRRFSEYIEKADLAMLDRLE